MSEQWTVHLVFTDSKSNKFWAGRVEGSTMYISYGRVGSSGQTSVKELGSAAEAQAELDKQAAGKRKKGYVDSGEAVGRAAGEAAVPEPRAEPASVVLSIDRGGHRVTLTLSRDGDTVHTAVSESYAGADAAAAAFTRIRKALEAEGYKQGS